MSDQQLRNILITGGAGFIGSYLCERFVREGANVICVDNFSTGTEKNIDLLLTHANFKFLRHDMIQPLNLESFHELDQFQVQYKGLHEVYHFACPTSPKDFDSVPVETLLANSHATYNALILAKQYGAKFLLGSSAMVYGEPLPGVPRIKEDYWGYVNQLGPRSAYNEGKRFAESLVANFRLYHKIDAKIARIFRTFGPRMKRNDGRMIPDFIMAALENRSLEIHGTDNVISSFLYIDDLVDGMVRLMQSDKVGPYNLGHNEAYRIKDVAQLIIKSTESSSSIEIKDPFPYVINEGLPDISAMKDDLGWFPLVDIEAGLSKTIEFMRSQRGIINV